MLALGEAGYREVTLLGQNIDAYGRDLPGAARDGSGRRAWTFTDLLRYVHDVPGIQRIRFATSHPRHALCPHACSFTPHHGSKTVPPLRLSTAACGVAACQSSSWCVRAVLHHRKPFACIPVRSVPLEHARLWACHEGALVPEHRPPGPDQALQCKAGTSQSAWCARARSCPSCASSSTSPSRPATTTSCAP